MVDRLTILGKSAGAVRHQALALGGSNGLAEVGFTGFAEAALAAFGGIKWNYVVSHCNAGDPGADLLDHRAALVTEDGGKETFGVFPGQRERIGVTNAGSDITHQHLTLLRAGDVDFFDFQWFACFPGDCGS